MKYIILGLSVLIHFSIYSQAESPQIREESAKPKQELFITLVDTLGCDSIVQVYYRNGQLFYQVPYRNGAQNGWKEQYHMNGAISGKELMVDGKVVDGLNVFYWDNGVISEKGFFKNGFLVGKWYHYSSDGELFKLYYYNKKGVPRKVKDWDPIKKRWVKSGLM